MIHLIIEQFLKKYLFNAIYTLSICLGSGIPSHIAAEGDNGITILPSTVIPEVEQAVEMYHAQGGRLHLECNYGIDPLATRNDLVLLRDQWLNSILPDNSDTFSNVVSGDVSLLKRAILSCIELSTFC